jgi:hypothetical protein
VTVLCVPVVVEEAVWRVDWGVLYVGRASHIARMDACNTVGRTS